jgi:histidyl-tRNA synthetase
LKTANREQAKFVLILGEEEMAHGTVQVKDMETGEQEAVSLEQVVSYLSDRLRK